MAKLRFVDNRPFYIPTLKNYKNGITPHFGEEIEVTENEKIRLMRMKNGSKPCWEVVSPRRKRTEEISEE